MTDQKEALQKAKAKTNVKSLAGISSGKIEDVIKSNYGAMIKKLLPEVVTPDRFITQISSLIRSNQNIAQCEIGTVLGSVIQIAQLGLSPSQQLGHAYIVPYGKEAKFILGYRGMIALAERSGKMKDIYSEVVHENDEFEYTLGLDKTLKHIPAGFKSRGEPIAVYAVIEVFNEASGLSSKRFVVLTKEEVMAYKSMSPASSSKFSPWNTNKLTEMEMWKKTAIRRLFKVMPYAIEEVERKMLTDEKSIDISDYREDGEVDIEKINEADEYEVVEEEETDSKASSDAKSTKDTPKAEKASQDVPEGQKNESIDDILRSIKYMKSANFDSNADELLERATGISQEARAQALAELKAKAESFELTYEPTPFA